MNEQGTKEVAVSAPSPSPELGAQLQAPLEAGVWGRGQPGLLPVGV